MQVRHFVKENFASFPSQPSGGWLEECVNLDPSERACISKVYDTILAAASPPLTHLKNLWERDLDGEIPEDVWQHSVGKIHSTSICVKHGLLQFKVLHRLHLSKHKLSRIYPQLDPTCSQCNRDPATLIHMFWGCPALSSLWSDIFETFSCICGKDIRPDPIMAIFAVAQSGLKLSVAKSDAIAFMSLLARRLILLKWKSDTPPLYKQWFGEVMAHLRLEKLKYSIRGSVQKFFKVWQPFLDYFDTIQYDEK